MTGSGDFVFRVSHADGKTIPRWSGVLKVMAHRAGTIGATKWGPDSTFRMRAAGTFMLLNRMSMPTFATPDKAPDDGFTLLS